jgi:hypothetical protein
MRVSRIYGDFRKSKNFTLTNDAAALNGTKSGPNWLRLVIADDGTTYDLYSSSDGVDWDLERNDTLPQPLDASDDALQFGPAGYFANQDSGPFVITIERFFQAPINTVLPAITGTLAEGQTLTLSNGTWDPAATSYARQWLRNGVSIGGATSTTYALQAADTGATNNGGSKSATAAGVGPIVGIPINTVAPAITGTVTVGSLLTCSSGTWSGGGSLSYAYQWKVDGVTIVGATSSTYTILTADQAGQFTCVVTATNAAGAGTPATSNTTVAVPDPSFSSTVLLLGFDGVDAATTSTDASGTTPHTLTFSGDAQLDTAQKQFGSASVIFDGTADHISIPSNSDFHFTNQPFTIELWVRFNVVQTNQAFISKNPTTASTRDWNFGMFGGHLNCTVTVGSTGTVIASAVPWAATTGVWYHVAVDRSGNDFRVYANGVMLGKVIAALTLNSQAGSVFIGRETSLSWPLNGWIDEIRVTKGVARYATDGSFTVPPRAFPRA